ncbi:MAG: GIY-YIG nuclease family protein [Burkholderiales bacterium]
MAISKRPRVYILASQRNGTLYIGVTSDVAKRVLQHRRKSVRGFAGRYGVRTLVYYEMHGEAISALRREKQLMKGHVLEKAELVGTYQKS